MPTPPLSIYYIGGQDGPTPVSLTSIVCKLIELLIRDGVLRFLEMHNKITPVQHGFRPGFVLQNY